MTGLFHLALRSLLSRRWTALLTVLAISVSVAVLFGVERLRTDARSSFENTISGTDIIVGARTGPVQLLLYSVFRVGNATNNIRWRSYQDLSADPRVDWTIPMSLGDSHQGFRVLGTTQAYFDHYRYGGGRSLQLSEGQRFDDLFDVVLGAAVARELGYGLGDRVIIEHGLGGGLNAHDDKPFTVSGILAPTGTAIDRTLHVSLRGIEAMHVDWNDRSRGTGRRFTAEEVRDLPLEPAAITAFLVGLKSKTSIFSYQRDVNNYLAEPLMAILPGVTLYELWSVTAVAETALTAISICVVVSALLGLVIMLMAGLNERRREMAILRALGAGPRHITGLLVLEALVLTVIGGALGLAVTAGVMAALRDWLAAEYGLFLSGVIPAARDWALIAGLLAAGMAAGLIPALRAARNALADGLAQKT